MCFPGFYFQAGKPEISVLNNPQPNSASSLRENLYFGKNGYSASFLFPA